MAFWLTALATVALILAAAKAHGRQLRLEREARGHMHVDFRRDNHPFVEALWRRDRIGFWGLFAVLLVVLLFEVFTLAVSWTVFWTTLLFGLAWIFVSCFMAMGLWSLARLHRDGMGEPHWRRRALRASQGWWGLVLVLVLLTALSALVRL